MGSLKIYQSSAGSGKTYTLVREFLLLIIKNPNALKHTLAVTFTNDATGEMKDRLIHALWQLSVDENTTLKNDLLKELNSNIPIEQVAALLLGQIIHHYSNLNINTIDSFFLNITRSIAYESGLPGRYGIDLNQDKVIDFAVNKLLMNIGVDDKLTYWLTEFVMHKIEEEKSWNIRNELKSFAKELFKDQLNLQQQNDDLITMESIQKLIKIRKDFWSTLIAKAKLFQQISESAGASMDDFYFGEKGFYSFIKTILSQTLPTDLGLGKRTNQAYETGVLFSKNANPYLLNDQALQQDLFEVFKDLVQTYRALLKNYVSANAILEHLYQAAIVRYLSRYIKEYRKEFQVLLMSDIGPILNQFIAANDAPFIYEKAGNRYRNFLIDEFQDTSSLQWTNILPLLINSLAEQHQVLTVGDGKQSIYRWRGGDMELLMTEVERILKPHAISFFKHKLDANFRSAPAVVDFNNAFFSNIDTLFSNVEQQSLKMGKAYHSEAVSQQKKRNHLTGFVCVDIINAEELKDTVIFPQSFNDKDQFISIYVLNFIQSQLSKGYKPGDIAILVRNNSEGSKLSEFLIANGFTKINSKDSLLIHHAPQIRFIVSCLRFINNPNDKVIQAHIQYFSVKMLLLDRDYVQQWFNQSILLKQLGSLSEICKQVVNYFKLSRYDDAYIHRFEELILESMLDGVYNINLFLDWWDTSSDRKKVSVKVPVDEKAITISTIHNSKGLQYPIVILPYLDWELNSSKGVMWVQSDVEPFAELGTIPLKPAKKLLHSVFNDQYIVENQDKVLEEVNILYVACTRAEEKLYLIVYPRSKKTKNVGLNKVSDLVTASLEHNEYLRNNMMKESEYRYFMGEDSVKTHQLKVKTGLPDDATYHMLHSGAEGKSYAAAYKIKKFSDQTERKIFGVKTHDLLSVYQSPDDEPLLLGRLNELDLEDDEKLKMQHELESVFSLLKDKKWHQPIYKVLNEMEITDGKGSILRPDRLMIQNNDVIVLDYKTGLKLPEHFGQMKDYGIALTDAGFNKVDLFLYYLETRELIQVKD
jgi:ATP-dependent exoDNAse (exonuclease V) beta subunit